MFPYVDLLINDVQDQQTETLDEQYNKVRACTILDYVLYVLTNLFKYKKLYCHIFIFLIMYGMFYLIYSNQKNYIVTYSDPRRHTIFMFSYNFNVDIMNRLQIELQQT